MGMDQQGNIREITKDQPIREDEVPIGKKHIKKVEAMNRAERRRLYREEMKKRKRGNVRRAE